MKMIQIKHKSIFICLLLYVCIVCNLVCNDCVSHWLNCFCGTNKKHSNTFWTINWRWMINALVNTLHSVLTVHRTYFVCLFQRSLLSQRQVLLFTAMKMFWRRTSLEVSGPLLHHSSSSSSSLWPTALCSASSR